MIGHPRGRVEGHRAPRLSLEVSLLDGSEIEIRRRINRAPRGNLDGTQLLSEALQWINVCPWFEQFEDLGVMVVSLEGLDTGPGYGYIVEVDLGSGLAPITSSLENISARRIRGIRLTQVEELEE